MRTKGNSKIMQTSYVNGPKEKDTAKIVARRRRHYLPALVPRDIEREKSYLVSPQGFSLGGGGVIPVSSVAALPASPVNTSRMNGFEWLILLLTVPANREKAMIGVPSDIMRLRHRSTD